MERYSYVYRANYMPLVTCKKLEITIDDFDLNANSRPLKVYGFKCPIPVRVENLAHEKAKWKRNHTNVVYYISSGNLSSWAIMYYSHASDKPKIKPDIAIVEFPVTILSQLIQDERSQPYVPHPFFKNRSFFSDFLPHRTTESIDNEQMSWSPLAAEERLLKFLTEIRENKERESDFYFLIYFQYCGKHFWHEPLCAPIASKGRGDTKRYDSQQEK